MVRIWGNGTLTHRAGADRPLPFRSWVSHSYKGKHSSHVTRPASPRCLPPRNESGHAHQSRHMSVPRTFTITATNRRKPKLDGGNKPICPCAAKGPANRPQAAPTSTSSLAESTGCTEGLWREKGTEEVSEGMQARVGREEMEGKEDRMGQKMDVACGILCKRYFFQNKMSAEPWNTTQQ